MTRDSFYRFDDCLHIFSFLLCDAVTIIFCFFLGNHLWHHISGNIYKFQESYNLTDIVFNTGVILFILIWGGTYHRNSSVIHVVRLKNLVKYVSVGFVAVLSISFFTKTYSIDRIQAFIAFSVLLPVIILERRLMDFLWGTLYIKKYKLKKLLIYGAGDTGKRLAKSARKHPKLSYKPIGFIDDEKKIGSQITTNPLHVLGSFKDFVKIAKETTTDEVWIAMPKAKKEHILHVMESCVALGIPYKFVPSLNELALHRVDMQALDGVPLFGVRILRISILNRLIKRAFDITFAGMTLLLMLPIFAIFAILIKRDSEGPVIFKQKRVGLKSKEFDLYKFRSMFTNTEAYALTPKNSSDPRITRVGRFLRRTSLDELPQFWNVLKGDMSVVGPRPEMPFIVATYNDIQRERLSVKPGITGIWQISGDRSLPIHENIDHDLYYIEHQSLLLDIIIIFQTIFFAIKGVGAW